MPPKKNPQKTDITANPGCIQPQSKKIKKKSKQESTSETQGNGKILFDKFLKSNIEKNDAEKLILEEKIKTESVPQQSEKIIIDYIKRPEITYLELKKKAPKNNTKNLALSKNKKIKQNEEIENHPMDQYEILEKNDKLMAFDNQGSSSNDSKVNDITENEHQNEILIDKDSKKPPNDSKNQKNQKKVENQKVNKRGKKGIGGQKFKFNNQLLGNVANIVEEENIQDLVKRDNGLIDIKKFEHSDWQKITPVWAQKKLCLDSQKRPHTDSDYDPTTLYIPPEEFKKLSPSLKQYWTAKSKNFDKIILFKLHKYYEIYYDDAIKVVKHCNVNFCGKKLQCGFWETSTDKHITKLIEAGFKVAIVEVVENFKDGYMRKSMAGKDDQVLKREVMSVYTKATYWCSDITSFEPRYLWVIQSTSRTVTFDPEADSKNNNFATKKGFSFCIIETSLGECEIGYIDDDLCLFRLKMLLSQQMPWEVVYDEKDLGATEGGFTLLKIFSCLPSKPNLTKLNTKTTHINYFDPERAKTKITDVFQNVKEEVRKLNPVLDSPNSEILSSEKSFFECMETFQTYQEKDIIYSILGGALNYLDGLMICEKFFGSAKFKALTDWSKIVQKRMILDSQSLEHLEI